jgi:hypothetical protein
MTDFYATLDGHRVVSASVHVPGIGVWFADVELEGAPELAARATLALGELRLAGTVDRQGSSAGTVWLRLVGGAGGWSRLLPPRSYHSDAGVRARTVAEGAAREAGEELGGFLVDVDRLGVDYVRSAGPASQTLADVAGPAPWWVDFEGRTHVGPRGEVGAASGSYEVTDVAPDEKLVTLAVDDLRAIAIGSVLSERLDAPLTVREYSIELEPEAVRVRAWCGTPATSEGRIARALRAIVRSTTAGRILGGPWRYRVARMIAGGRAELEAVVRDASLPNIGPVSMWPGVAGASVELDVGAELLVDFIDGDRRQPIVRGFAPKGGAGHVPLALVLAAEETIRLMSSSAADGVAKSSEVNARIDEIAQALDAFANATPAGGDGGAALQTALKTVGGWGTGPHPPADTGSTEVFVP